MGRGKIVKTYKDQGFILQVSIVSTTKTLVRPQIKKLENTRIGKDLRVTTIYVGLDLPC